MQQGLKAPHADTPARTPQLKVVVSQLTSFITARGESSRQARNERALQGHECHTVHGRFVIQQTRVGFGHGILFLGRFDRERRHLDDESRSAAAALDEMNRRAGATTDTFAYALGLAYGHANGGRRRGFGRAGHGEAAVVRRATNATASEYPTRYRR